MEGGARQNTHFLGPILPPFFLAHLEQRGGHLPPPSCGKGPAAHNFHLCGFAGVAHMGHDLHMSMETPVILLIDPPASVQCAAKTCDLQMCLAVGVLTTNHGAYLWKHTSVRSKPSQQHRQRRAVSCNSGTEATNGFKLFSFRFLQIRTNGSSLTNQAEVPS